MSMKVRSGDDLGNLLIAAGVCPKYARNIELHIPASGAVFLRYEVYVEADTLAKISEALATFGGTPDNYQGPD